LGRSNRIRHELRASVLDKALLTIVCIAALRPGDARLVSSTSNKDSQSDFAAFGSCNRFAENAYG